MVWKVWQHFLHMALIPNFIFKAVVNKSAETVIPVLPTEPVSARFCKYGWTRMRTALSVWSCFVVPGSCESEIKALNFCTWSPAFHLPRGSNLHSCKPEDAKRCFFYFFFILQNLCLFLLLQLIKIYLTDNYQELSDPVISSRGLNVNVNDYFLNTTELQHSMKPNPWDIMRE